MLNYYTYITWIVMTGGAEHLQGRVQNLSGMPKLAFLSGFLITFWKKFNVKCESHPRHIRDRVLTEMGSCLGMALECKQLPAYLMLPSVTQLASCLGNRAKKHQIIRNKRFFPIYQSVYFVLISSAKGFAVFFRLKLTYLLARGRWNGENAVVRVAAVRVFAKAESPQCTKYR